MIDYEQYEELIEKGATEEVSKYLADWQPVWDRTDEAKYLLLKGIMQFRLGGYQASMEALKEALEIAEVSGPKKLAHHIINYLVWIGLKAGLQRSNHTYMRKLDTEQGKLSGRERSFFFTNHAYAVSLDIGFIESEKFSDRVIGNALDALKNVERRSARKDRVTQFRAQIVKGIIHQQKENWDKARSILERAYKDARDENYPFIEADIDEELGNLHYREGLAAKVIETEEKKVRELFATAGIWFSKALSIWKDRNRDQEGILLASIGEIQYRLGDLEKARESHAVALEIFEELEYPHGIGQQLDALGRVQLRDGEVKDGIRYLKKALKIFRKLDVRHEALLTRVHLVDGYFLLSQGKGKRYLKKLIYNEPVKRYIDCYRELKEIVLRESWLRDDPEFGELFDKPLPRYITIELLEQIIEAAKRGHPNEFGALIHGDPVMDRLEFVLDSARGSDTFMFSLYSRYSGDYIYADGSVHSHPSGAAIPSKADLSFFGKFPNVNIIIGYPYTLDSWAAYDRNGNRLKVGVIYRDNKEKVEAMVKKLDGKGAGNDRKEDGREKRTE